MRRPPFAFVLAVLLLAALPTLSQAQSAPTPASREAGAGASTDLSNAKPGRETNITYTHLDDAVASAHETEWKQWYKDNFVQ